MVHTFEIYKIIPEEIYNQIINTLQPNLFCPKEGVCVTSSYAAQGFQMIRLYKFRGETDEKQKDDSRKDNADDSYLYMIDLSINPSVMIGGDPYHSFDILSFGPAFVQGIYREIFKILPCLQIHPELLTKAQWEGRLARVGDEHHANFNRLMETWLEQNMFYARRIDFAFDIWDNHDLYLMLLGRGSDLRKGNYKHRSTKKQKNCDNKNALETSMPEINDIYYEGDSLNINIYHKGREVEKKGSASNSSDLNFVRFEVQAKKEKLKSILSKMKKGGLSGYEDYDEIPARDLQSLIIPEVAADVLEYYVNELTGSGDYVKYDSAVTIIDGSSYGKLKKEKMKAVIQAIDKCKGIAKMLELVENGIVTDLGKISTVENHLRDIRKLGINPVVLPDDVNVPDISITDSEGNIVFTGEGLRNLNYHVRKYGDKLKDEKRHGRYYAEGELDGV